MTLAAATAVTAAGSVVQGVQARAQGNYENQVQQQNAALAAQARRQEIDKGVLDQVRLDRQTAQVQGAQRVAMAGAGVDTTYGTAANLQGDTSLIGSEKRQDNVIATDRAADGYSISAWNDAQQGAAAKAKGQAGFVNGLFSAGSTILGGAAQVGKYRASMGYGGGGKNSYGVAGSGDVY